VQKDTISVVIQGPLINKIRECKFISMSENIPPLK
jgi:hypothetical protein